MFPILLIFGLLSGLIFTKINNAYRPSIYNYESYLSPEIVKKIKNNFDYREFKEISEFTQALSNEKAIAGIGSDFQAAELIIDNKIKKLDFEIIFGKDANNWKTRKKLFKPLVAEHLEKYDQEIFEILKVKKPHAILDETKKTYDVNGDKIEDHIWEYVIPYFTQDKGIAYSINKTSRPHINENVEKELKDMQMSWKEILTKLYEFNYRHFGWTNAHLDNLMIGANYLDWENYNRFDETNFKDAIKGFSDFVQETTKNSIKNTNFNYFNSDGLALLNHLIEPKPKKSDVAILYNGDALDAYYSSDNFQAVEEGLVRFIRPKNNFLLMDVWIVSKTLTDEQMKNIMLVLKETLYANTEIDENIDNIDKRIYKLEDKFFNEFLEKLDDKMIIQEKGRIKDELLQNFVDEYNETATIKVNKNTIKLSKTQTDEIDEAIKKVDEFVNLIKSKKFDDAVKIRNNELYYFDDFLSELFTESSIGEVMNFDFVVYTPTEIGLYEFIKKWYFADDEIAISMYEQPEQTASYNVKNYPIIETKLRTKIIQAYFEATRS
ncbi:hypothetical protein JN00_0443 [Metamycoplasma subdolum]|uniref:Spermidine/putrescine transport system substrate-binding protein n=1 Tax=Metamycoplasma subdolum TaxID=92407 RepID=A0A3M0AEI1_9BACT|nr:hypothetical protein JN00_0443 [Metamycoplasma subdolum]